MKKDTFIEKLICILVIFFGSAVCGLGIQLTLTAGIGVDPITMFEEGIFITTGISVGTAALLLNIFSLTLGFFLRRSAIGLGSVVCTFCVGPFINLWGAMGIARPESFWGCLILDILGVAIIGLGIAIYMLPQYGIGGMEALMLFFTDKFKTPMGPTRVVQDGTLGIIGLLLGGTLGVGTVVGGFGIGLCIQFFYTQLSKLVSD